MAVSTLILGGKQYPFFNAKSKEEAGPPARACRGSSPRWASARRPRGACDPKPARGAPFPSGSQNQSTNMHATRLRLYQNDNLTRERLIFQIF